MKVVNKKALKKLLERGRVKSFQGCCVECGMMDGSCGLAEACGSTDT